MEPPWTRKRSNSNRFAAFVYDGDNQVDRLKIGPDARIDCCDVGGGEVVLPGRNLDCAAAPSVMMMNRPWRRPATLGLGLL